MVEAINGFYGVTESQLSGGKPTQELGLDNFLKMLLAQLKHQDPLKPVEGTEFSAQLAQFSSLEQLFSVNSNLESIIADLDGSNRYQALDLIGKEITAKGDMLSLESGKTSNGAFSLDRAADCTVLITDSDGYPVRKITMGSLQSGQHSFEWDGLADSGNIMEPGTYGFKISALDQNYQFVPVESQIMGLVNRVSLQGSSPILFIGKIPINMSQVIDIRDHVSAASP